MTESADLLAAIAAAPADDLPRLVFADWLDDRGEPAYAQFIRDQIRLAQVPQWDPLAVRARHQLKDSLGIGRPFFGALPELPIFLKWHPEKAFRRGFGSGVVVHQLSGLLEAGPQLFDLAPVEELWLSAATLDEWRQLAKSPWLKKVRKLHFHFSQGLHEPIRCLAESKYASNIEEIWFDTLETPAAGLVIEALAQSPLAGQLKGLHLRLVHTPSLPELIAALAEGKFENLLRLSMEHAGLDSITCNQLFSIPFIQHIQELNISNNPLRSVALFSIGRQTSSHYDFTSKQTITRRFGPKKMEVLRMSNCNIDFQHFLASGKGFFCNSLRMIDLSNNQVRVKGMRMLYNSSEFQNIRCLILSNSSLNYYAIAKICTQKYFRGLIELNLSGNTLTETCALKYLKAKKLEQLEAIVLNKDSNSTTLHSKLESHFGDRLVWAADDAPTGLAR